MRLLHARSLKFQDFNESSLPPYAILSHTWDASQEVSLQEMTSPYLPSKKGYAKITETCRLALSQGLEYAWIDTCCIDKTSSAELTESINSMFRWYQKARVCYAYLSDFHTTSDGPDLAQCAWFTRGWTLQELIAPPTMEFYNSSWEMIGTRYQLEKELSSITGIPILAFGRLPAALRSFSVAQKMSWASSRVTTRTEDVAYCLLGLFGVHMPLIYGEGSRAFHRLQEEIARRTDDLTLFAWVPAENNFAYCSLLASSPAEFGGRDVVTTHRRPSSRS
ncbi:HET-domain-containing protein [Coniochaeta ligniaria NRRL 30616]|uniref:HET-domain-containing protein n=1 Tax=Coniochaeta ligniaria NRRL 30616 TaxID=1408157 RepID=A0A1J7IXH7_9PEZI|nr:HET-domain-containing protein [Coniochaeta ligniaria NRRL 30616]